MRKKKSLLNMMLLTVLMLSGMISYAQDASPMYLTAEEMPDAVYWLPAPPAPGSSQFMYDISQYYWGKEQRKDTIRSQKAIREAAYENVDMIPIFSEVFGMEISEEKTPAIYKVVDWGVETIRLSATAPKETHNRIRPYVYFNEPTLVPEDEEELRTNGSYPSGHTIKAWGMAMILCELNPDVQDELFKLAYEYGQSRVIAGFHWQSDVDASRLLAAATYARLQTCKEYLKDMEKAKKEFKKLKKK